ncbi:Rieske 2Fe-2S domain-containing protein [Streptomyces amakusaensis]|uniref:Rieske-type oxygenase n=1 Tax=Streptomyces amakusaensis TaxID=67271 RepID=A0ABW0AND2_9ACTN
MRIRRTRDQVRPRSDSDPVLPYPNGWFCVGTAAEWRPKTVLTKPFMGQEIVVYRTERGTLRAVRPHCPHLGAHLGFGGTVDGELLVCPFHRFAFGPDGACARTPYGLPPRAGLQLVPVTQAAGLVWAWHSHDGTPPSWQLPEKLTRLSTRHIHIRSLEVDGHSLDVAENAIDFRHFPHVHRIDAEALSEPKEDGPFYHMDIRLRRPMPPFGTIVQDFSVSLIGVAGPFVEIDLPLAHARVTGCVFSTPIAPRRNRIHFVSAATFTRPGRPSRGVSRIAAGVLESAVSRVLGRYHYRDAAHDFPIWSHREFLPHPRINGADSPIGPFRIWARQFYPSVGEDREAK